LQAHSLFRHFDAITLIQSEARPLFWQWFLRALAQPDTFKKGKEKGGEMVQDEDESKSSAGGICAKMKFVAPSFGEVGPSQPIHRLSSP